MVGFQFSAFSGQLSVFSSQLSAFSKDDDLASSWKLLTADR
jgi:hypothetical protein